MFLVLRLLPGWNTLLHTFSFLAEFGVVGVEGITGLDDVDPADGIDNDL